MKRPSLNRALDWVVGKGLHAESQGVSKATFWRVVLCFGTVLAAIIARVVFLDMYATGWRGMVVSLCTIWIGIWAGAGAGMILWRRAAYVRGHQIGYHQGRLAFLLGMQEAQRRGLHFAEWIASEMERDGIRANVVYDDFDRPEGIEVYPMEEPERP